MAFDLATAQHGAAVLLNLAVAVTAGASMAALWLGRAGSGWARGRLVRVRHWALGGALAGLLACVAVLWLESAAMAEVPVSEAGPAVAEMLGGTHFGLAFSFAAAALALAAGLAAFVPARRAGVSAGATLAALAVFWYARSMVSHAASEGDFSLPLLADWAHLGLVSLWVGEVIVAGLVVLLGRGPSQEDERRDRAAYVASLSSSATFALAGIFATGLFGVWHNLGSIRDLVGNPYGNTLLAKLAVVGLAALLGGVNRFFVMPAWLAREGAGQEPAPELPRRFRLVLQVEAAVLLVALFLAVLLAATSPPGAGA